MHVLFIISLYSLIIEFFGYVAFVESNGAATFNWSVCKDIWPADLLLLQMLWELMIQNVNKFRANS